MLWEESENPVVNIKRVFFEIPVSLFEDPFHKTPFILELMKAGCVVGWEQE